MKNTYNVRNVMVRTQKKSHAQTLERVASGMIASVTTACLLWAIAAAVRPKVLLIADNLCLGQQLLVLQRRKPRPSLKDADRRFWVLACRWFVGWRTCLLIVKPETVLGWHRHGWRTYWRRHSRRKEKPGRRPIPPELRTLIRRMSIENQLCGVSGGSRRSWRGLGLKFRPSRRNSPLPPPVVGWQEADALCCQ